MRSTKKLPSRKMRGRILAVASSWSGSAVLVDLHHHERLVGALLRLDRLDLADLDAGDPHRRVDADRVGRLEHRVELEAVGERDVLREARGTRATRTITSAISPTVTGLRWAAAAGGAAIAASPPSWPAACRARCRSRSCPVSVRLVARLALLAAGPATPCSGTGWSAGGCPRVGPLAGADDGPPSLFGPCGVAMMMKRCQVPLTSPSLSSDETLRNHSVM